MCRSIWSHLSDLSKDNSGYSLKDLFIGSEGTLGIITSAILKLFNRPNDIGTAFISIRSYDDILKLFNLTTRLTGSNLTSFEFMSRDALLLSLKHGSTKKPVKDTSAPCYVLIELSTSESNYANTLLENLLSSSAGGALVLEASLVSSSQQAATLWNLRENMSEAQKKEGGSIKHDISLPLKNIPEFLKKAALTVAEICTGARPVPFGHIGDGNIHYNISQPIGMDKLEFLKYEAKITEAIHDLVSSLRGSISAEHGIGRAKREELRRVKNQIDLDLMRSIKSTLDPRNILNPGKLL
ncbi:MAG: FAD-binding oxidoreductase [Hyphomicrobium sp.]